MANDPFRVSFRGVQEVDERDGQSSILNRLCLQTRWLRLRFFAADIPLVEPSASSRGDPSRMRIPQLHASMTPPRNQSNTMTKWKTQRYWDLATPLAQQPTEFQKSAVHSQGEVEHGGPEGGAHNDPRYQQMKQGFWIHGYKRGKNEIKRMALKSGLYHTTPPVPQNHESSQLTQSYKRRRNTFGVLTHVLREACYRFRWRSSGN